MGPRDNILDSDDEDNECTTAGDVSPLQQNTTQLELPKSQFEILMDRFKNIEDSHGRGMGNLTKAFEEMQDS